MKKILLGLVAILVVLTIATTNVNAASLTVGAGEVEKGKEVTVTLKLDNPVKNVDATLKYDSSKFEYVKESVKKSTSFNLTENPNIDGEVLISGDGTTAEDTFVFTFKAKETETAIGAGAFSIDGEIIAGDGEETVEGSVSITVKEPIDPSDDNNDDSDDNNNNDNNNNNNNNKSDTDNNTDTSDEENLVDSNGKQINKLPQTGTQMVTIVGVVAGVVIAAGVAIIMIKKSK